MVIVMKHGVGPERIQALVSQLEREHGVAVGITNGVGCSILGLVGDTAHIDMDKLTMNDDVERVMRVQESSVWVVTSTGVSPFRSRARISWAWASAV